MSRFFRIYGRMCDIDPPGMEVATEPQKPPKLDHTADEASSREIPRLRREGETDQTPQDIDLPSTVAPTANKASRSRPSVQSDVRAAIEPIPEATRAASGQGAQTEPVPGEERSLDQMLEEINARVAENQRIEAAKSAEQRAAEAAESAEQEAQVAKRERELIRRYATNTSTQTRLAAAERDLQRLEGQGFFASYPVIPENEFPTLLTRLPIFRATRRRRQHALQDVDNALSFTTPFGEGKRHGPPLTVRDEDTLIALMRLRSKRLYGRPEQLPIPIADIYQGKGGRVGVHYVVCSIDDLVRQLGLTDGGENYRRTFDSVKRLGATTLELNLKTHERYLGSVKTGRMLQLLHVQWQVYERDGLLVVLFPPVVAQWLEDEYTYIDWRIRLQLDDLGKCLHRFLSGQPKRYQIQVLKLADTVGYDGPRKNLKQRIGRSLDKLIELGWLKGYVFSGNGRSVPLSIQIER